MTANFYKQGNTAYSAPDPWERKAVLKSMAEYGIPKLQAMALYSWWADLREHPNAPSVFQFEKLVTLLRLAAFDTDNMDEDAINGFFDERVA